MDRPPLPLPRLLMTCALAVLGTSAAAQQASVEALKPGRAGLGPKVEAATATSSGLFLMSQVDHSALGSVDASDVWGYTDGQGREYAIICLDDQTAWVDVTDPSQPEIKATKNGPSSSWRDVKVYQEFAYIVSEGGQGIQIFDMTNVATGSVTKVPEITTPGTTATHNVALNEDSGFLYRCGGGSEGLRIYDLNQSLTAPPHVGTWSTKYVHDAQIVSYTSGPAAGLEVAYCFTGGDLTVLDVTNKSSISVMGTETWPFLGYSHQGWLDENQQYLYVNDEQDELTWGFPTTTIVIDVSNPFIPNYITKFDNGLPSTGHNVYVKGDLLYQANYSSGLRVFDIGASALNPPEVAFWDTIPDNDDPGFQGLWSIYPYFPSGLIVGSDSDGGLYIWYDDELVDIDIPTPPAFLFPGGHVMPVTITQSTPGVLQGGTPTLHYDAGNGWETAPLVSVGGNNWEAHFPSLNCGSAVRYYFSAQSTNGFTWFEPYGGQSAWIDSLVATSSTEVFADDFEQDLGWVAENAGATDGDFDRGVPINDPGWPFDPLADADGSGQCWITDNALGNTDVDNGSVRIVSPALDLTGASPVIQYDYYLNMTDESGLDFMKIKANDFAGSGWQTVVTHSTSGDTGWRRHYLEANDFIAAGVALTSGVKLRFTAKDSDPQTTVEAGVDGFKVLELTCAPITSYCTAGTTASGCVVQLTSTGTPSLSQGSGFTVSGANGEGSKDGLFFFSQNGQQAAPWGNGTSLQCVTPPVQRTAVQPGGGTNGACDANWQLDFNAWAAANPGKAPAAGTPTQIQFWFRDPQNTSNQTTSLSDALSATFAP